MGHHTELPDLGLDSLVSSQSQDDVMDVVFNKLLEVGILSESAKGIYYFTDDSSMSSVNHFSLWDMAGALMEKCLYEGFEIRMLRNIDEWSVVVLAADETVAGRSEGSCDAYAIIEACCEALSNE